MTLAKVARKANVAIATASKVFNNDQSVRSYLRERVLEAAAELNYQPSMIARGLRKKQTNIVTLGIMQLENPYFGALAQAVIKALADKGYVGIACIGHDHIKDINVAACACGSIVSQALSESLDDLAQAGPIVTINNRDPRPDLASDVHFDFGSAYQAIIMDLKQQGVSNIVFGCDIDQWHVNEQQKFRVVHQAFCHATDQQPIVLQDPLATLNYLASHPQVDAVFCVNDPFAADLITLMHANEPEMGKRVKVVGCDGNRQLWGNWTVQLDVKQIAEMAVDLLDQRLHQGDQHEHTQVYHPNAIKA
ncbi:MAG: LacI family DNA-binding transcriptional regulator [Phycisphaeraceae bacterium JB051]